MPLQIAPLAKSATCMAAAALVSSSLYLNSASTVSTITSVPVTSALVLRTPVELSCSLPSSSASSCFGQRFSLAYAPSVSSAASSTRRPMTTVASSAAAPASAKSVHEFTVKNNAGEDIDLSSFKGKVLLIVNVASACGLTRDNYTELTGLYNQYRDKGLEILAFPCNQFGGQEPGSNEQIKEFACSRFKAEFPIFDKVDVNGPNTAPVYQFLKAKKGGGILGDNIKWNFGKFLVDQDGNVVERYAPTTSPKNIEEQIIRLLGIPPSELPEAPALEALE
ncbi:hypothetical protein R1sor_020727 [Riccia sorocarpa]|uniref:Glutathione peroxidase n=1 Tax=Riccia sorocarpa TaxID=122646 RepID=A0ABD3GIN9_9MARC